MTYEIWTKEERENIRKAYKNKGEEMKVLGDNIMEVIHGANSFHEKEMLKKDITIAGLQGTIEGMKK